VYAEAVQTGGLRVWGVGKGLVSSVPMRYQVRVWCEVFGVKCLVSSVPMRYQSGASLSNSHN